MVSPMASGQKVIDDEIGDRIPQPSTAREVGAEMDPGEDPARGRLFRSSGKTREGPFYPRQNFRGHLEVEMIVFEEETQNVFPGSADDRVGAWVGRVWRGVADLGKPSRIGHRVGIVVRIGSPNRRPRPPEVVG